MLARPFGKKPARARMPVVDFTDAPTTVVAFGESSLKPITVQFDWESAAGASLHPVGILFPQAS